MPPIKDSIFAVMIVLFAFKSIAADAHHYEFVKLILQWPSSSCNTGKDDCKEQSPDDFIIGSFAPMMFNDTVVLPYNRNDPCVAPVPLLSHYITEDRLGERFPSMEKYWPYLLKTFKGPSFIGEDEDDRLTLNVRNWRSQWRNHGRCFKYPIEPERYFATALDLRQTRADNMLDKLVRAGLRPGTETIATAFAFAIIIHETVHKWPQIRCNRDASNHLQLHEVALCFDTKNEIIDCKKKNHGCEKYDHIKFPVARNTA